MMLGSKSRVAVQDPSYPVYVDTSVIMGMTGDYNAEGTHFNNVQYMPCRPDNGFFPDLSVVSNLQWHQWLRQSPAPSSVYTLHHLAVRLEDSEPQHTHFSKRCSRSHRCYDAQILHVRLLTKFLGVSTISFC